MCTHRLWRAVGIVVLLVVTAFLLAKSVVKTGLGRRISLRAVTLFGRSTLGLAYSVFLTDALIAPAFPSNTSRAGVLTCSIVTTPALAELALVHDRMPLILPLDRWDDWLGYDASAPVERIPNSLTAAMKFGLSVGTCGRKNNPECSPVNSSVGLMVTPLAWAQAMFWSPFSPEGES